MDGSLCGSSLTSLSEDPEANHTSSSDSKLYKNKESSKMLTSTYPCLRNTLLYPNFLSNRLEKSSDSNKSISNENRNNNCSSTMCSSLSSESYENNSNYETNQTGCERLLVNSSHDKLNAGSTKNLNVSRKNSDCKYFDPQDCYNCSNVIFQQTNDSKSGEFFLN